MKKKIAAVILFIAGGILIAEKLIGMIVSYLFTHNVSLENESLGIIGGADGPTSIVITTGGSSWLALAVGIILVVAGVIVIRKKS